MKWDIGNRVEEWSLDIPSWVENFPMQRDTSESAPEDTVIWDRDQGLRECPGDPGVSTPCFHCRGCRFHSWLED